MKLVTFTVDGRSRVGAYHNGRCYDLDGALKLSTSDWPRSLPATLCELLAQGEEGLRLARTALDIALTLPPVGLAGVAWPREAVTLEAPVTNPSKIIAIGLNYRDHCTEQNIPVPEVPTVFAKFPTALTGDGQPIRLPPREVSAQVDFEVELAVVIGRAGRDIPEHQAYEHIAGYTICHDVSARDVQFGDGGKQWIHGKSFDTFCPLGPWLVTRDEVPDPHALDIQMAVNGTVYQASNTSQLVFRVPFLVAELSKSLTLLPGDVIATGTPGGVGVFRDPPIFLQDGDECVATVQGLGQLRNPVRA